MLTHANMLGNGFFSGGRIGFRVGDRYHSARPFFHVAGTSLSILSAVQHVVTLVTMDRFDAAEALALMERERCTHLSGNDTMALMLLNHPDRQARRLVLRGAWVAASPAVLRRVADELGAAQVVAGYGLSEASPQHRAAPAGGRMWRSGPAAACARSPACRSASWTRTAHPAHKARPARSPCAAGT